VQNRAVLYGSWPARFVKKLGYLYVIHRCVKHLVCVSENIRRQHAGDFRIPADKLTVVENGLDLSPYQNLDRSRRDEVRRRLGVSPGDFLCLNVGRLDPQKGQNILLKALAAAKCHRPCKVVLVGDITAGNELVGAPYRDELHRAVERDRLHDRVVFAGWRDDIPQLLAAADCYVHPSLWEGLPLAILEGMASGLPVVFTDCFERPSGFVPGTHGLIVATGQDQPLAEALQTVCNMSDAQRATMGQAARELAFERFDVTRSGKRFVAVIERVLNGRPGTTDH